MTVNVAPIVAASFFFFIKKKKIERRAGRVFNITIYLTLLKKRLLKYSKVPFILYFDR